MTDFEELDDDPFSSSTDTAADTADNASTPSIGNGGVVSRLFDGDAVGPQVPELQGDYGFSRPWAMVCRGTLRVATGSGVPPVFEIVAGAGMAAMSAQEDGGGSLLSRGEDEDSSSSGNGSGGQPSTAGSPPGVDLE